ncbi:MAG: RdgB/HAM1 family non-canonical purine NTP pyrophosphatase [Acidimicrobiia bacterium]|nr:RdgB/HAM1 family non-canonical purine NTP pyrophosphatase [Acidimicrobiia bacterium]
MNARPTVVMASANPHKVEEIALLMEDVVQILPRPSEIPDVVEDADTLEGNARLKAAAIVEATALPAIADDTGLEIDHLDGAPGVHTARFAGEKATSADNIAKTLAVLRGVPDADRTARFRTVALLRYPDGRELIAHGVVEGRIALEPRGSGGFGYDSVFIPVEGRDVTFAQMDTTAKQAISHRGRAFRSLRDLL